MTEKSFFSYTSTKYYNKKRYTINGDKIEYYYEKGRTKRKH